MSTQANTYLSPEEYLEIERKAEFKSEYFQGRMFAMSGASREHVLIAGNIFAELRQELRNGPCETYIADMRVRIGEDRLYTYPDVVAVCGERRFADGDVDTLLNPTVLVEVLSESTQAYDRGVKFELYRKIDSLREYILVAQDRVHIEHYVRQHDNSWLLTETNDRTASVELPSLGCSIPVERIYERLTFESLPNTEG